MLKRGLIALVFALAHVGCSIEQGVEGYQPREFGDMRKVLEDMKRQYVTTEDLKIGHGAIAALGRRVRANIHVTFENGTVLYDGPYFDERGFFNAPLRSSPIESVQYGIWLGMNGMAVGGARRMTLAPGHPAVNSHPQAVVVEATLTDSCIPVFFRAIPIMLWGSSGHLIRAEVWCRAQSEPKYVSGAPSWHLY
jgi:hypothetical protein